MLLVASCTLVKTTGNKQQATGYKQSWINCFPFNIRF